MRRLRTSRTCRAAENPTLIVLLVDSNATQTDALVVTVLPLPMFLISDSNATQMDSMVATVRPALADSNADPLDAISVEISMSLADLNATPTDLFDPTVTPLLADSNTTPTDTLSASERFLLADSNASPTDLLVVTTNAALVDANDSSTDFISVGNNFGLSDQNSTQTDILLVRIGAALADSNATPTDIPNYFKADLIDSNAGQTDVLVAKLKSSIADSNSSPTDALSVKLKALLADFNATQTDTFGPHLLVAVNDSNASQTDAITAKVTASIADSSATPTDALVVSVIPNFPPNGAIMAWRADSGVTISSGVVVASWTDSILGKVATATQANFNATEASFNNKPGMDFNAASFNFFVSSNPAIPDPYWIWGVILPGTVLLSDILRTGFNAGNQFDLSLGGGAGGGITLQSNTDNLNALFNASLPTSFSVRIGGAGTTSSLYINGVLKATSIVGQFVDAALSANTGFFIGNRQFTDRPTKTICEFGFSDDTFSPSQYDLYTTARYGF